MRNLHRTILALATLSLLAGCSPAAPAQETPTNALVAAPDGSGSRCTDEAPCSLDGALDTARSGQTISLHDGDYGDVTPQSADFSSATQGIVVEGGEAAVIGKLDLNIPGVTWRGMTFTGGIYLDLGAAATRLEAVHVDGSGVFVHADGVVISDALIENGTSIDGVQVGAASELLIENSIIRGFGQGADSDVHSDCVQLFDSSDIVLRGNYFGGCDNAALIFSPGGGEGISNVLVEGNYLQGCVEKTDRCSRGTALDLREATAANVVVRNNTILDGSVMVEPLDGLVFDRNIVGYVSNCDMPMTNSIIIAWNTGSCDEPDAVGQDGNRVGSVDVVDKANGDLRPTDAAQTEIEATGDTVPAESGYDGAELAPDIAGAGG